MFATNWMRFGVTISVLVLLTETKFSDDGEIDNESVYLKYKQYLDKIA